ncbi:dipeptide/oligopeptide/nickel ABC transporter ATP-binding protein [Thermoanaerobacterium thermosaccharolyticum]|uniref:Dipeptide/oligopeptide/nickel ABC transporter ATP-binding protein n=1 Tax=Thermoanaerobacterium thermosaccharolyticum TaxID=1517 RepID=A0A231VCI4_THETR|nr:ABC transporter ATP-binding protein [Thermoanaerobacterium thermosaccharolyticum]OXT05870.1 dipeptide/oligopeptide/nickel ABC transporter ATP-binding protein [Thermoanaerobacterium thermosaccharolyticum]
MAEKLLEVKNLKSVYKTRFNEKITAVDDVSFDLEDGKCLGIAGESGSGKSTLAMSIMGYYYPPLFYESGSVCIGGVDFIKMSYNQLREKILGKEIAYIPQAAMNALNPTQRIINLIEDVMKEHVSGITKNEIKKIAEERFETLNLPKDVLQKYPIELSGGMKQRTVIAISTILNPKILIADEPTSALDVTSQKIVIKLLKDLIKRGFIKAMVFITHELPLLYNIADDIMVMYAGEIVESGEADEVIFDPIHPYSNGLMNSIIVPEKGIKGKKLTVIPGAPPNLKYKLEGCRFSDRCLYAKDECKISKINMKYVNNSRSYRCVLRVDELKEMYENGEKRATT